MFGWIFRSSPTAFIGAIRFGETKKAARLERPFREMGDTIKP
jgi:hypothetical protein